MNKSDKACALIAAISLIGIHSLNDYSPNYLSNRPIDDGALAIFDTDRNGHLSEIEKIEMQKEIGSSNLNTIRKYISNLLSS